MKLKQVNKVKNPEPIKTEEEDLKTEISINNDIKKSVSTVPTYTPRNYKEQFVFYDDGAGTERLYIYINNSWKYTTLT